MLRRSSRKQSSAMGGRPHASVSPGEITYRPSPASARPGGDGSLPLRLATPRSNLYEGAKAAFTRHAARPHEYL